MTSRHRRSRFSALIAAGVLLAVAACHRGFGGGGSGLEPALLFFTNESLDQANVYAVVPGVEARRIGTVMPGRTDTLSVPADLVQRGSLNIVARIFARSTVAQTGNVILQPGEEYTVKLPFDQKLLSFLPAP